MFKHPVILKFYPLGQFTLQFLIIKTVGVSCKNKSNKTSLVLKGCLNKKENISISNMIALTY